MTLKPCRGTSSVESMTQWMGGMGIIVLSLAMLPVLGIGGMQLFVAEVPGPTKEKLHPGLNRLPAFVGNIHSFTAFNILLLHFGGMSFLMRFVIL
jgi:trk system potassium uptake protein